MKVTIDFETRSTVDLKKCGMYVYAEDPTTDVLCLAIKEDNKIPVLWVPSKFRNLLGTSSSLTIVGDLYVKTLIYDAETIESHNAGFERCIWRGVMCRYGFDDLPYYKIKCSAARAAAHGLPRDLGRACAALGLSQQKDNDGRRIMLKMCKPRAPRKADKEKNGWEGRVFWHEDPSEYLKLCEYCVQDTEAEYQLSQVLPELNKREYEVWNLDQIINGRGVPVDIHSIQCIQDKLSDYEDTLLEKLYHYTSGIVKSTRQVAVTLSWLKNQGLELPDLQKNTISAALEREDFSEKSRNVLEIRQALGKSSTSKLDTMLRCASKDHRVRGTLMYHGAATGRWSGKLIQPQNYPRGTLGDWVDLCIESFCSDPLDMIQALYGCPMEAASSCLRGLIKAEEGKMFICADFASIEARVLAWLAGQTRVLEAFTNGKDLYKVAAADIYKVDYNTVTKDQRFIGKTAILALGYQGGIKAFQSMAANYGVNVPAEQADRIISDWRKANPRIARYWNQLERAAYDTVKTGNPYICGLVTFGIKGNFLYCKLPSWRMLAYCDPRIEEVMTPWGDNKMAVTYMTMNTMTNSWVRRTAYGGLWTENVVQAVARDLLAEAMLRIEDAGYPIVMSVHDEIVCEVADDGLDIKVFENLMSKVPAWAEGCPVSAEGWIGKRFKK